MPGCLDALWVHLCQSSCLGCCLVPPGGDSVNTGLDPSGSSVTARALTVLELSSG